VCAEAAAGPEWAGPGCALTRVSTGEQADSGAGLAAQESQLRAEAERRGWLVNGLLSDAGASGSSMRRRPALADALALVDHGQGDVLAVAKLDRLSRSVLDFAQLMVRPRDLGWGLVARDESARLMVRVGSAVRCRQGGDTASYCDVWFSSTVSGVWPSPGQL